MRTWQKWLMILVIAGCFLVTYIIPFVVALVTSTVTTTVNVLPTPTEYGEPLDHPVETPVLIAPSLPP
jgi:hypothetical protein